MSSTARGPRNRGKRDRVHNPYDFHADIENDEPLIASFMGILPLSAAAFVA